MHARKPHIPWFHTEEMEWLDKDDGAKRFEEFASANADAGRNVVVGPGVVSKLKTIGYGGTFERAESPDWFESRVRSVDPGTAYVLAVLRPDREYPIDSSALGLAWSWLAGPTPLPRARQFIVAIGRVGTAPTLIKSEDRPYRLKVRARWTSSRCANGVVAPDRHDSPSRLRPCDRRPEAQAHPGARHQLRCLGPRRASRSTAPGSMPLSRVISWGCGHGRSPRACYR